MAQNERRWTIEMIASFWEKIKDRIDSKASFDSPVLTGIPTAPTAMAGTSTDQIATTAFVMREFQANDALDYKGTIGSTGATVTSLPAVHTHGWAYKVVTSGTYAGKQCNVGDMIICVTDGTAADDSHWSVVPLNDTLAGITEITSDEIEQIFRDI